MLDALEDAAGLMQFALALPVVVLHAESPRRLPLFGDEIVAAGPREIRQPIRLRCIDPPFAVLLPNAQRNRYQILARIAVLGQRKSGFEGLAVTRVDRTAQRVELSAGIVDDPFDKDFVAAKTHRVGKRGTDRHRAPLNDDERSRWVGAAELERDA